jgi:hypothetical protein
MWRLSARQRRLLLTEVDALSCLPAVAAVQGDSSSIDTPVRQVHGCLQLWKQGTTATGVG